MLYNEYRRKTRQIRVGRVAVGGNAPVSVQSMTNTDTLDFAATLSQIRALEEAGCDIVRLAVPHPDAAATIYRLKEAGIALPLVADIHFDYKAAIRAAEAGADKIRINPGNIGSDDRVKAVAQACRSRHIPIRVGVNSGSLEGELLEKYGAPTAEALAESAMRHVRLLEKFDFDDIIIAVKSSDPARMNAAVRIIADQCDYPFHLGVTEAGTPTSGIIKSAAGIGSLLLSGIGDTIRVSLTADPVREVIEGKRLLSVLGIEEGGVEIVSCPTCGRTRIDLIALAERFETAVQEANIRPKHRIKVAVMGCAVNGPGEAREADFGIAGGIGEALLFRQGEIVRKIPEEEIIPTLLSELKMLADAQTYND